MMWRLWFVNATAKLAVAMKKRRVMMSCERNIMNNSPAARSEEVRVMPTCYSVSTVFPLAFARSSLMM